MARCWRCWLSPLVAAARRRPRTRSPPSTCRPHRRRSAREGRLRGARLGLHRARCRHRLLFQGCRRQRQHPPSRCRVSSWSRGLRRLLSPMASRMPEPPLSRNHRRSSAPSMPDRASPRPSAPSIPDRNRPRWWSAPRMLAPTLAERAAQSLITILPLMPPASILRCASAIFSSGKTESISGLT